MLAPPHRVFGNSPEFLALKIGSQYAFRAVYKLHEARVIEARDGHDHLDTLQLQLQQHLVLGLRPREVVEEIWTDWTKHDVARTNEFGDVYLPILSGDHVRPVRKGRLSSEEEGAAESERVSRHNYVKRRGGYQTGADGKPLEPGTRRGARGRAPEDLQAPRATRSATRCYGASDPRNIEGSYAPRRYDPPGHPARNIRRALFSLSLSGFCGFNRRIRERGRHSGARAQCGRYGPRCYGR